MPSAVKMSRTHTASESASVIVRHDRRVRSCKSVGRLYEAPTRSGAGALPICRCGDAKSGTRMARRSPG